MDGSKQDELRDFFLVLYRALKMITAWIRKKYNLPDE